MDYKNELLMKLDDRRAVVAVIGLGYVGLPLAVVFAEAGFHVIGFDLMEEKVASIKQGKSYIQDIETGLLAELVEGGKLEATTDFSRLLEVDAVAICVPTPLRKTGDPDISYIISATDSLSTYVHPGMVVSLESSTYPGTTSELLVPRLATAKGLEVGQEIFITFSPERVDPGRMDWTTYNTPKVLGGITENCTEVGAAWYGKALETVVPVSSTEVAEMVKLLENTFRMINIGLVNEMAIMCERLGVDVWEVVNAAGTKPFGFMKFSPGPGLGGHCIPIDPLYLSWKMRSLNYSARFIELASEINTQMPRYVVQRVQDALNEHEKALKGSNILILGVAYKPNIDDLRESPALDVIHLMETKGANVSYHDPYVPSIKHEGMQKSSVSDLMLAVRESDCVVIVTNHKDYDYGQILANAKLIFDTRNGMGDLGKKNPKVVRL